MKTVNEVSRISGVSVRTLHHYDSIGLLAPSAVTPAGYRLYDDAAVERLQSIMLLRELRFSLSDIRTILDTPGLDRHRLIEDQITILEMQKEQIDKVIDLARTMLDERNENKMDFSAFDKTKIEKFAAEAKERWGSTDAYKESEKKNAGRSEEQQKLIADGLMDIFRHFGEIKTTSPESEQAQDTVRELRKYITDNYYECTKPILAGLGEMYAYDERFRQNIDSAAGEGTAVFAAEAIRFFCR